MKDKSKDFIITGSLTILISFFSPAITITAAEKTSPADQAVYIYPGALFTKASQLESGIIRKEYCSEDALRFVKKYYKRKYPDGVEVTLGTKESKIQKLLLDVKSPLDRHKSRKSISLLTADKKGKCRTILWIEELSKVEVKKEAQPPPAAMKEKGVEEKVPKTSLGLGAAFNAVNTSAGPALFFGPHPRIVIQANMGGGEFKTRELKAFYKHNLNYPLKPYLGAGFLHAEKEVTVLGRDRTIEDDSYSLFAGVEYKVQDKIFFYLDIAGTPLELEEEVASGSTTAIAKVSYSAVAVNMCLIFYAW